MALGKRRSDHAKEGSNKRRKEQDESTSPAIRKEEALFPRGGGSVLTPLEQRQIQIQAKQDVLFEERTGQKPSRQEFDGDENASVEVAGPDRGSTANSKKRKNTSRPPKDGGQTYVKPLRISSLSYKVWYRTKLTSALTIFQRLLPGSIVLGQVSHINRNDIALSLPNNLSGFIPLTSISDQVTKSLECELEQGPVQDGVDSRNTETAHLDLGQIFCIGQYLRAYVVSTYDADESTHQRRRHIELSIKPQQANAGLSASECCDNSMIQASVVSVEDHGIIMDLGLRGSNSQGFLPAKEAECIQRLGAFQKGSVHLCFVTGKSSNGKVLTLSLDPKRISNLKKASFVSDTPSVDCLLPGTAVEFLVSEIVESGIIGKFMGVLDVTAHMIHSSAIIYKSGKAKSWQVGNKAKGRVIFTLGDSAERSVGISTLDHILQWKTNTAEDLDMSRNEHISKMYPISSIVENAEVIKVVSEGGLYLSLGAANALGYAHISRISDKRIDSLAESMGSYRIGTKHKARITAYNSMDGLFILSLEQSVIEQPFLFLNDVKAGQSVRAKIDRLLVGENGVSGLILELSRGVTGLVPEIHLSDVRLQHPERKFREGMAVNARVIAVDIEKRHIRLTLKKSLVNDEGEPWTTFEGLSPGMQSRGTIVNILPNGAVVQFFGSVRGFLPISQMSETFISDPKQHFQIGQVVNVHIIDVDLVEKRMTLSCKDPNALRLQQQAVASVKTGEVLEGEVIEKTTEELVIQVASDGPRATLPFQHLTDGSSHKATSVAKRIRVGQKLKDILVLSANEPKNSLKITSKPSMVAAARSDKLLLSIASIVEGAEYDGFVNNITPKCAFIRFANEVTGLLLKQHVNAKNSGLPDFGLRRDQSLRVRVYTVDRKQQKFLLTTKTLDEVDHGSHSTYETDAIRETNLSNPVDGLSKSTEDFVMGKLTKARIVSVKETQLNVQLADGVQGRIDVCETFDGWSEVKDRKHPLKAFHPKQEIPVRILGVHDSRNHRFLPISHRQGRSPVFELTAKPCNLKGDLNVLSIDKVEVGSSWLVSVNNVKDDCIWVNISPNVRGRIRSTDISDDVSLLKDLSQNFPVGSLMRAKVVNIDVESNHLDLTGRSDGSSRRMTLQGLSPGLVLPGRVTKVMERLVVVQLSETVSGSLHMIDMSDDYTLANPSNYRKNQTIRVCVLDVDRPNKKVRFSTRPSRILSSALAIDDPEVLTLSQLQVNQRVRGFVKNVTDQGLFVSIGSKVTSFVRVSDLSDAFIKDWKSEFEVDQLVEGKIISIDPDLNHVQMSLRKSHLEKDYKPPLKFEEVLVGQIVSGTIRKVVDFGVFVLVDDSANVSGLCHRTKMSDNSEADPQSLYSEGDAVKAKVLAINEDKRQVSFGLKASYFLEDEATLQDADDHQIEKGSHTDDASTSDEDGPGGVGLISLDDSEDEDMDGENYNPSLNAGGNSASPSRPSVGLSSQSKSHFLNSGLSAGGFDWTGGLPDFDDEDGETSEMSGTEAKSRKKKRRKPEIKFDRTADLDANGPQSTADFERLLLGQPNSSALWVGYMAFHLQLSEIEKARETAERALKTIHIREEGEKLNLWIALLNLENTYGTAHSLEDIFRRACQYNDAQEIHERLTSIYIQSGQPDKADELFQATLKKYSQSPALYLNYATFLFANQASVDRARALLPRAMQALPPHTHVNLTAKFAQLEFKHAPGHRKGPTEGISSGGDSGCGDPERGRTIFETLLTQWPKRLDLWNVLLDMEIGLDPHNGSGRIRNIFERITTSQGTETGTETKTGEVKPKLKPKQAKHFFKRWLDYEEKYGDERNRDRVKALAAEYVNASKS